MFSNRVLTWAMLLTGEALLAAVVAGMFWYQDWQYSLPTPRPAALEQPAIGAQLELPELKQFCGEGKSPQPVLLHFFNPSCPCSQFNLDHVRDLIRKYRGQVQVIAVLESDEAQGALDEFAKLKLPCPALVDDDSRLARRLGVYATPQGVVISGNGQLCYRGNYNRGRYCTALDTQFVRLAIDDCLAQRPAQKFPKDATLAVGCALPIDRAALTKLRFTEER